MNQYRWHFRLKDPQGAYSDDSDHRFRAKLDTDSDDCDQRFHSKLITLRSVATVRPPDVFAA